MIKASSINGETMAGCVSLYVSPRILLARPQGLRRQTYMYLSNVLPRPFVSPDAENLPDPVAAKLW